MSLFSVKAFGVPPQLQIFWIKSSSLKLETSRTVLGTCKKYYTKKNTVSIVFFQSFRFEQYKSKVYDHAHMTFKEPAITNLYDLKILEQNEQSDDAAETSTFYSLFHLSLFP